MNHLIQILNILIYVLFKVGYFDLIFNTFLYHPLMGIIKQNYNKFRLYFEHKYKKSKDISLVICINENKTINFITVMLTDKNKRVRQ